MKFTEKDAIDIILYNVEYDGEVYTIVPYRPMSDDLIWNYTTREVTPNEWTTNLLYDKHNVNWFTLTQIEYVAESDKVYLADVLGYDYDELFSAKEVSDDVDSITPASLSFTESKYITSEESNEDKTEDVVNHPNHYNSGKFETIEMIEEVTKGYDDGFVAYAVGNTLKYVSRAPFKHGEPTEDLRKAKKYLEFAIEYLERD